jgi:hypothetical protein
MLTKSQELRLILTLSPAVVDESDAPGDEVQVEAGHYGRYPGNGDKREGNARADKGRGAVFFQWSPLIMPSVVMASPLSFCKEHSQRGSQSEIRL